MEPILTIFSIGTNFAKACTNYILIKKVEKLKGDIGFVKGSFLDVALDFVQKASKCENPDNSRFFLESAYSNFSHSISFSQNSIDELKEMLVKKFQKKVTMGSLLPIPPKFDDMESEFNTLIRECDKLEMSYFGKAMCEYNMNEFSMCINTLDLMIGIYYPIVSVLLKQPGIKDTLKGIVSMEEDYHLRQISDKERHKRYTNLICKLYTRFYFTWFNSNRIDYYKAINNISKEKFVSVDKLFYRNKTIVILALAALTDEYPEAFIELLKDVTGVSNRDELFNIVKNVENQDLSYVFNY